MQDIQTGAVAEITSWLVSEGRLLGDGVAIVEGFADRLVAAGVPLSRVRVAQRLANPLLASWGRIWTAEETEEYTGPRSLLDTGAWQGSPFQYVTNHRTSQRKRLLDLNSRDHSTFHGLASTGATDFFVMALEYGDGSVQGCSFVTHDRQGFAPEHLALFEAVRHGLASAMEPVAMRRSSDSLLRTYLGDGPAKAVAGGTIQRGEQRRIDAVVMFSDLRGFTKKSIDWSEEALLSALNSYFEIVVDAVREYGGDILKFMGDGVLSVFPVQDGLARDKRCLDAAAASRCMMSSLAFLNEKRGKAGLGSLDLGTGIDIGCVIYGNIGSPDRLDFTVLGQAVNLASRVQDLCKTVGEPVLATGSIAVLAPSAFRPLGAHTVKGMSAPIDVYGLQEGDSSSGVSTTFRSHRLF